MMPQLRVTGVSAQGPLDPAFRVRLTLLSETLAARGIDLRPAPLFSQAQALAFRAGGPAKRMLVLMHARHDLVRRLGGLRDSDTMVVQRQIDLLPALTLERRLIGSRRLIYDVDDAIWITGGASGGHYLSALKGAARKVAWLASRADSVVAANELLAEYLSTHNPRVSVIPSLIDPADYAPRRHASGETLTLGWIGSPTTVRYLDGRVSALSSFARQCKQRVRLLVVGGSAPRVQGIEVREIQWNPAAERAALAEMDIGLMPLPDTAWTRGKCAYKALQYLASAVPAVVDDVGVSARVVAGAGIIAHGDAAWVEALAHLGASPDTRQRLGDAGRLRVEQEFSPDRWGDALASIWRGD